MGMVGRIAKRWREAQSQLHRGHRPSQRRGRRPWRRLEGAAAVVAILAVGRRRLAGDSSGIDAGHHYRRFYFRRPRTGAGRSRDRQLARLHRRAAELASFVAFARPVAATHRADAAAAAIEVYRRTERGRLSAGRAKDRLSGRELHSDRRQGARHHRPDGFGKIVAGAHAGRRVVAVARHRPARRRHARPMVAGGARPARRLSAAGCGIVSRQRGAKHRAFRGSARTPRRCWRRRRRRAFTI